MKRSYDKCNFNNDTENEPYLKKRKIFVPNKQYDFRKQLGIKEIRGYSGKAYYGLKDWVLMKFDNWKSDTWYWVCWIKHPWDTKYFYMEPVRFNYKSIVSTILIIDHLVL